MSMHLMPKKEKCCSLSPIAGDQSSRGQTSTGRRADSDRERDSSINVEELEKKRNEGASDGDQSYMSCMATCIRCIKLASVDADYFGECES